MKNKGFGHLKTRLFTIKTSKNLGFEGPWYVKRAKIVKSFFPQNFVPLHVGGKRKNIFAWNLLKNQFNTGCLVISNHFPSKDLVHHPIDSQPIKTGCLE